jgi:hypothetical protein
MGTASLNREQLNEAMEQFANRIVELFGVNVADEETGEPELTGTRFKAIGIDGKECVVDAASLSGGTLVREDVYEYFRCYGVGPECAPWVRYTGKTFTHEEFAEEMRNADETPRIVHVG